MLKKEYKGGAFKNIIIAIVKINEKNCKQNGGTLPESRTKCTGDGNWKENRNKKLEDQKVQDPCNRSSRKNKTKKIKEMTLQVERAQRVLIQLTKKTPHHGPSSREEKRVNRMASSGFSNASLDTSRQKEMPPTF